MGDGVRVVITTKMGRCAQLFTVHYCMAVRPGAGKIFNNILLLKFGNTGLGPKFPYQYQCRFRRDGYWSSEINDLVGTVPPERGFRNCTGGDLALAIKRWMNKERDKHTEVPETGDTGLRFVARRARCLNQIGCFGRSSETAREEPKHVARHVWLQRVCFCENGPTSGRPGASSEPRPFLLAMWLATIQRHVPLINRRSIHATLATCYVVTSEFIY